MRDGVLAGGELLAERLGEGVEPRLGRGARVERVKVFIVYINAICDSFVSNLYAKGKRGASTDRDRT